MTNIRAAAAERLRVALGPVEQRDDVTAREALAPRCPVMPRSLSRHETMLSRLETLFACGGEQPCPLALLHARW